MPLYYKSLQVVSIPSISAITSGATLLYATENGTRKFYAIAASIECTAASGVVTVMAASVGTNSTSYNNIVGITTMTGLTAASLHFPVAFNASSSVIAANTGIFLNVTTIAVATSQTVTVHLIGFYS